MYSLKSLLVLLVASLSVAIVAARSSSGSRGSSFGSRSSGSSFGEAFWQGAYSWDTYHWPKTPGSKSQFVADNAAKMWKNRPAQAQAAICFNGSWRVKNPDQVSPAMTVTYFVKKNLGLTKKALMYDCLYIWGPNQSWWSWDDADDDKMAHVIDDSKCTYNSTTWDIDCI
ncbi:uncharacterized protein PAN0_004d2171 [Moesziomyces antarcticus]|uniref:Uncharacterized protein n=2 Tax=Pseudozyma antarctica TaxID=84753 RepID=A0A5C3FMY9_PSEA2|nr:uncharacterized protein PAN0_004d2171 [Moesziomyces antarcticus]GAK63962.1 conserved hypothetical protein [Moesziomyces antarcticus]SPO44827.1 uncharacterized protein PSANT_02513 [Moesziomyces antarcticus]